MTRRVALAAMVVAGVAAFAGVARAQDLRARPPETVTTEVRTQVGAVGSARVVSVEQDATRQGCIAELRVASNVPVSLEARRLDGASALSVALADRPPLPLEAAPVTLLAAKPGVRTVRIAIRGRSCDQALPVAFTLAWRAIGTPDLSD